MSDGAGKGGTCGGGPGGRVGVGRWGGVGGDGDCIGIGRWKMEDGRGDGGRYKRDAQTVRDFKRISSSLRFFR